MSNPDQQPETRVRTEEIPKSIAMRLAKAAYEATLCSNFLIKELQDEKSCGIVCICSNSLTIPTRERR